jgi:hypothetical protein
MADEMQAQLPTPDPALARLDRFVGTWSLEGHLVGSDEIAIRGQTTFRWLPGGFFLEQHGAMNFLGMELDSLELIGYDPETDTFPSTVFTNISSAPPPVPLGGRGGQCPDLRVVSAPRRDVHGQVRRRPRVPRKLAPQPGRGRDGERALRHRRASPPVAHRVEACSTASTFRSAAPR